MYAIIDARESIQKENVMKTFVGIGNGTAKAAVEEALKGLSSPSMILFITPYEAFAETAETIHERFPEVPSIGAVGTKFANGVVSNKNIVVLGLFGDAKVSCGVIEGLSRCPIADVKMIEQQIKSVSPGNGDTVCLEYCTGQEERLVTTLHSCLEKREIPLAGGTVFDIPEGKAAVVAYNGRLYEDASVYAIIKNTTGKIRVYQENIYRKKNDVSHFATKVDVSRRALCELDGRPAADVYSEELGVPKNQIVANVLKNPMGRVVGNRVYISAMSGITDKGELTNYKRINKNDCIYFLELGDYRKIEEETRSAIRSEMSRISLVISIDCAHRHMLYSSDGYLNTYAKDMASLGTHIGTVGGGEQFNNQHVNQTMVCAVFE